MLICKVNCPDSSAGANVKYAMEGLLLRNRSSEQLSIEREEKDMVLEIQTIIFRFVVREEVLSVL
jgi:hypothetical protein